MQIKGVKLICKITSEASGFCSNQAKAHLIEIIKCVGAGDSLSGWAIYMALK